MKKIVYKTVSDNKIIKGIIPYSFDKDEYVNLYPYTQKKCKWLNITDIIFDKENISINYEINTAQIKSSFERTVLVVDEAKDIKYCIDVYIIPDFTAKINKYNFSFNDEGNILIKNNTQCYESINISSSENYIKFADEIKTNGYIKIPFTVKMPIFARKQMEIASRPYNTAQIRLLFKNGKKIFNITIGTSFEY